MTNQNPIVVFHNQGVRLGGRLRCLLRALPVALTLMATLPSEARDLTGTPMGSPSDGENSPAYVFDNNFNTYYASTERSHTWVGVDLGAPAVIRRIGYAPRRGMANRMLLGVFEGANEADFSDAVPLYIVAETPADGKLTTVNVRCNRGFRYVRYVGPHDQRCNISEIRLVGNDGEGDDSTFDTLTGLPFISIHTENGREVTSKTTYLSGDYTAVYDGGAQIQQGMLQIRGRGNASWDFPKKPYKIKLDEKQHLMGLSAKARDWTLINNYGDKTLMRNLLAFETSRRMGMAWTPEGVLVDVLVNDEYQGTYQLCDQVEVGGHRVDVARLTPEDNDPDVITGGYLLEMDAYANEEPCHFTSGTYGIPVTIKYPDYLDISKEQKAYIKSAFDEMCKRLSSSKYKEPEVGIASRLDLRSFIQHFLVGEYTGNTDTYWSVNMYKDRDDSLFHVGPVWDFDLAFENDNRTYPVSHVSTYLAQSGLSSAATGVKSFMSRIVNASKDLITEVWTQARYENGLTPETMLGLVDSLAASADASQELNFIRWPILNQRVHQNFQALGSYEKEVEFMKQYVEARFDWMDKKAGIDMKYVEVLPVVADAVGVMMTGRGMVRLSGFAEGSVVQVIDLSGRLLSEAVVTAFDTDIALPEGLCVVIVQQPNGSVSRQKIYVEP